MKNLIWQEKYRPKTVADVISPFTEQIQQAMENPLAIQNFIFYSKMGGTGKTSMSKAIVNDLQCDVLNLNASDERSIDTIRTKVKEFMRNQSSNPNSKKCIIMDEGEKLTRDAQDAMKNMMEEYSANVFVVLTTNNIQKLSEPLKNRFKVFEFIQPNKNDVAKRIQYICEQEGLEYTQEGVEAVVQTHYPSVRGMVNHLQDLYYQKKKVEPQNVTAFQQVYEDVWGDIQNALFTKVKKQVYKEGIDCTELNSFIFDWLMRNDYDVAKEVKLLPLLARNERDFKLGCNPANIFVASLPDMMKVLR